ncbi:polysaccharide deacetylase family protein, partial [Pseudooceanicola nitratireducens]|uniref:polysaccharide deacetylase family protein n=1 Tax=Pseudooceanicola nitratireducens TaxID=517719 RepID=UPI003515C5EC
MRFRRALLRAGVGFLTLGLLFLGFDRLTDSTTTQVFGTIIARVETPDPIVALTFDDGPSAAHTGEVLKILAERSIPATFFVLGRNVEANPDAVQA